MSDRTGRRQQRTGNQEDEMIDERQRTRQPRLCYLETAVALSADRPKTSGPAQSKFGSSGAACDATSRLICFSPLSALTSVYPSSSDPRLLCAP